MFEKLGEFFSQLVAFFPRLHYVEPHQMAVRIRLGSLNKELAPGWYGYWPIFEEIYTFTAVRQTVNLPNQYVQTNDNYTYAVSGVVVYRIRSAKTVYLNIDDYDVAIQDVAMCAIARLINKTDAIDFEKIQQDLLQEVKKEVNGWGIEVIRVGLPTVVKCFMLGVISDTGVSKEQWDVDDE